MNVGDDSVLPTRVRLDVVPQAISFQLVLGLPCDRQLAVIFLDVGVFEPDLVGQREQIAIVSPAVP